MLLYHGTSTEVALKALKEGLKTRRSSGRKSLWEDAPSHGNAVYLTDAYALYFALHTLKEPQEGDTIAVIEIDSSWLFNLVPDEDVLEQIGRGRDKVKGGMLKRTQWYRKRLKDYAGGTQWQLSMRAMGTCAHIGDVPASAITRVAVISPEQQPILCYTAMDPTITIQNYQICGEKYRSLTKQAFVEGPGIEIIQAR